MSNHKQNWLDSCPLKYRPLYYWQYVGDMFVLFKSSDHLKPFQVELNSCYVNISFTIETEQNKCLSKTNFSGVEPFWMLFTWHLQHWYYLRIWKNAFVICSNWSMFYSQLKLLREICHKNIYPENFIDRCFKMFLNRIYILK